ncbi:hypothetical protein L211DRAFT_285753 [Terfezia boudieri ATCC MYA-4762]|uniref:Uncharacterized protein n=1 Tax=Terfezia boudieri ATCC MYA-4762 TaxID=1051890 RepID=A0A3N4LP84_9PEZI|nr:hypothetical protein L211DRAFT_285753 [Terfezia boudieri ATCC MYA-4762]
MWIIPTVQFRSDPGDIELGKQSPPEYSAVYPDIYSSASPRSSSSFPFSYPDYYIIYHFYYITFYILYIYIKNENVTLFIYKEFRLCVKLLTGNRADWAVAAVVAIVLGVIVLGVLVLVYAMTLAYFITRPRGGGR